MNPTEWNREDRDLLVELRTEMRAVRSDIGKMSDGLTSRMTAVEQQKIDRTEINRLQSESLAVHSDHEQRIRAMETAVDTFGTQIKTWAGLAAGGLTLLQVAVQITLSYFHI